MVETSKEGKEGGEAEEGMAGEKERVGCEGVSIIQKSRF